MNLVVYLFGSAKRLVHVDDLVRSRARGGRARPNPVGWPTLPVR